MASLRERKKQQTRQALMDAAGRLFDEQGYEATTVDQIAAAAGVSPRTFFSYFRHKADLLHTNLYERLDAGVAAILAGRPGESPAELLARAFDEMLAESWTMGLTPGLVGDAVKLPIFSPRASIDRADTRMERLAAALVTSCGISRMTAYAMVGAAIGAVSGTAAVSMSEDRPDEETLALTSRACRQALAGFTA
ncbi:TetR/AcrR family transcriptional regulator [Nonomuraea gerenzanensis]|uniref:Transcriptional regulator, TetR family n=1 Tax=Nonomuraea gerenzanensis TaxID=93944 RepID=A0A1M4DVY8_9ACTN|nr:TetR/AcrR family transcriptional regulator [Nonomuraea gerenzanensis]UBU13071.1 TetR/AcrR family transcriptional regulator [Nonomuraea gerenzanensis]SBO90714.1 Transcriptional regulator, TetR family [Nonomuraea gerenzanensis]